MSLVPVVMATAGLFATVKAVQHFRQVNGGAVLPPSWGLDGLFGGLMADDKDILARTIWGEARGEGYTGMQAVANVIMNRYAAAKKSSAKARQFGSTVAGICQKPWQFSCWNANDPNRARLLAVDASDAQFATALHIADLAVSGRLIDLTGGADHYHTRAVAPPWSIGKQASASIGSHLFFNLA